MERLGQRKNFWKTKTGLVVKIFLLIGFVGSLTGIIDEYKSTRVYKPNQLTVKPTFPGGPEGVFKYVRGNFDFSTLANAIKTENEIPVIHVNFDIDKNGQVLNSKITKGPSQEADKEVLRVINSMPVWYPGKFKEKAVKTNITIPLKFNPDLLK